MKISFKTTAEMVEDTLQQLNNRKETTQEKIKELKQELTIEEDELKQLEEAIASFNTDKQALAIKKEK